MSKAKSGLSEKAKKHFNGLQKVTFKYEEASSYDGTNLVLNVSEVTDNDGTREPTFADLCALDCGSGENVLNTDNPAVYGANRRTFDFAGFKRLKSVPLLEELDPSKSPLVTLDVTTGKLSW